MRRAALTGALLAGVAALAWAQTRDARRSGFEFELGSEQIVPTVVDAFPAGVPATP